MIAFMFNHSFCNWSYVNFFFVVVSANVLWFLSFVLPSKATQCLSLYPTARTAPPIFIKINFLHLVEKLSLYKIILLSQNDVCAYPHTCDPYV